MALCCLAFVSLYHFLLSGRKRQTSQTAGLKPLWLLWEHCYLSWLGDSDTALSIRGQCTFPPCHLHPVSVASDFWLFVQDGIFTRIQSSSLLNISHPFCLGSFLDLHVTISWVLHWSSLRSWSSWSAQVWFIGPSSVIPAHPQLPEISIDGSSSQSHQIHSHIGSLLSVCFLVVHLPVYWILLVAVVAGSLGTSALHASGFFCLGLEFLLQTSYL